MAYRLAINGFGRIGRCVLRALHERGDTEALQVVAINDLGDAGIMSHLTRWDSTHGPFPGDVRLTEDNYLLVNDQAIALYAEPDPRRLPWQDLAVDAVLECSGTLRRRDQAAGHLEAGASKVVLSAPAKDEVDATVVYGINEDVLSAEHDIISNASCTTNCVAALAKPLVDAFGIDSGLMTTVHSYTNDQGLIDQYHSDPRRARSATQSMIPTSTNAMGALGKVLPALRSRIVGYSMRVPTLNVSVVDLSLTLSKAADAEAINEVMRRAADSPALRGILAYNEEPLVSHDFNHHSASAIFDATQTQAVDRMVKVLAWYDNEWGYSNRMLDIARVLLDADPETNA